MDAAEFAGRCGRRNISSRSDRHIVATVWLAADVKPIRLEQGTEEAGPGFSVRALRHAENAAENRRKFVDG